MGPHGEVIFSGEHIYTYLTTHTHTHTHIVNGLWITYLTSGFLSCPSLNLPAVTRYKLFRATNRKIMFSYIIIITMIEHLLCTRSMSLTNITASIGPTNAHINPLSTEIQQLYSIMIDKINIIMNGNLKNCMSRITYNPLSGSPYSLYLRPAVTPTTTAGNPIYTKIHNVDVCIHQ